MSFCPVRSATIPPSRTPHVCLQHRNSFGQDTLSAHHRAFAPEWQRCVEESEAVSAERSEADYNMHVRALPEVKFGSNVVVQNPRTGLWDIYGVIVDVGP